MKKENLTLATIAALVFCCCGSAEEDTIICLPGEIRCNGDVLETCNGGGTEWQFTYRCDFDETCIDGECIVEGSAPSIQSVNMDGENFEGRNGMTTVTMGSNPYSYEEVSLGVTATDPDGDIAYYTWEVLNYENGMGGFSGEDEVITHTFSPGEYVVKTYSPNITYMTVASSQVTTLYQERVEVTVYDSGGRWTHGYYTIQCAPAP